MEKDRIIIDVNPIGKKKPIQLLQKDWHIYAMCIFTIIICLGYYSYVQGNLDKAIDQCNEHWEAQVNERCPAFFNMVPRGNAFYILNQTDGQDGSNP